MKIVKLILKVILGIVMVLVSILLFDYLRLNLSYLWNQKKYVEVFPVQGNKNKYVPQGMTYSSTWDAVLQTSYNSKHTVSILSVTDFKTGKLLKTLEIKQIDGSDNTHHVGGITTDEETVWITSDYEINEFSLQEIMETKKKTIQSQKHTKLINRGDFCTFYDGILWIGDFYLDPFYPVPDNNPLLMGFKITTDMTYDQPEFIISLPKMVQGMIITPDYRFLFTESFTNLISSKLEIYDNILNQKADTYLLNGKKIPYYHFDQKSLQKTIKLPPMAEEFFYFKQNYYILFENSSDTYFYAFPKIKKVIQIDAKEIDKK